MSATTNQATSQQQKVPASFNTCYFCKQTQNHGGEVTNSAAPAVARTTRSAKSWLRIGEVHRRLCQAYQGQLGAYCSRHCLPSYSAVTLLSATTGREVPSDQFDRIWEGHCGGAMARNFAFYMNLKFPLGSMPGYQCRSRQPDSYSVLDRPELSPVELF